jgi:hypothetical protein
MTQHPVFVGTQMAFLPIGFAANLILNRLRNERQIADDNRTNERDREKNDRAEDEARAELERVNKRLALLRARVEPRRTGRKSAG